MASLPAGSCGSVSVSSVSSVLGHCTGFKLAVLASTTVASSTLFANWIFNRTHKTQSEQTHRGTDATLHTSTTTDDSCTRRSLPSFFIHSTTISNHRTHNGVSSLLIATTHPDAEHYHVNHAAFPHTTGQPGCGVLGAGHAVPDPSHVESAGGGQQEYHGMYSV